MDDAVTRRWHREQVYLGLSRATPEDQFARGGLAALAVDPTVRIAVIPGDPSAQPVRAEEPEAMVPKEITPPDDGQQLPYAATVRGTSSGYVAFSSNADSRWERFHAVCWHGGVDVFLGGEGGRQWTSVWAIRTA